MKTLTFAVTLLLVFANQSWAKPMKNTGTIWTAQDCSTADLTVDASNPTDCVGFVDSTQGAANDNTDILNLTPIFDAATGGTELFTGFFGFTDWNFAQKVDNPNSTSTDIDLGLTVTQTSGQVMWEIANNALGAYEGAIAIIKQAQGFDAYYLSAGLGGITGGSFLAGSDDWSHFSLYVRGSSLPQPDPLPLPGTLALVALGLMCLRGRRLKLN